MQYIIVPFVEFKCALVGKLNFLGFKFENIGENPNHAIRLFYLGLNIFLVFFKKLLYQL